MVSVSEAASKLKAKWDSMSGGTSVPSKRLPEDVEKDLAESELESDFESVEAERRMRDQAEREQAKREKARLKAESAEEKRWAQAQKELERMEAKRKRDEERALKDEANRIDAEEKKQKKIADAQKRDEEAKRKKIAEVEAKLQAAQDKYAAQEIREATREREKRLEMDAAERAAIRAAKTPTERIVARQAAERARREAAAEADRKRRGLLEPQRTPLTAASIRSAISTHGFSTIDRFATRAFGGAVDAIQREPTPKESAKLFKDESRHLSAAVRNKQLGKNPFSSVIGVSGNWKTIYTTDGHGRSGRRATLEWRRANRQYVSPARKMAAMANPNWMDAITGTRTPVRHRKTSTRTKSVTSPLNRLLRMI